MTNKPKSELPQIAILSAIICGMLWLVLYYVGVI